MSISQRLKELRANLKLSQKEFSSFLKIDSSQYGKIERGVLNPTIDHLTALSSSFNVSIDWILLGKGELDASTAKDKQGSVPQVITINNDEEDNIVLVPVKAQAGYLNGYGDPKFIEQLPSYSLPNMRNGIFRMFQVAGHSMFPTLHSDSYVVGQFVEDWSGEIKDNRIYIIVTQEHGVVIKRVLNRIEKYGNIYCKSDNRREYPSFSIAPDEIEEIWECKMSLSYEFLDPADIFDKVNDLEAEMLHLKDKMKRIS